MYKEEFQLIYHCKGGFSYSEVEDMPRAERHAFLRLLNEQFEIEKQAIEDAKNEANGTGAPQDIRRMPLMQNEVYGKSDLEKQAPAPVIARVQQRALKRSEAAKQTGNGPPK